MGHVEKVDRTLPLNQMIFHVRRDAELRRRWREDFDATSGPADVLGYAPTLAWRTGTGPVAWPQLA
jgi:hypothetical protein